MEKERLVLNEIESQINNLETLGLICSHIELGPGAARELSGSFGIMMEGVTVELSTYRDIPIHRVNNEIIRVSGFKPPPNS